MQFSSPENHLTLENLYLFAGNGAEDLFTDLIGSTGPGDLDLFFLFWYEHKLLLDALQYSSLSGILVERATNFSLEEEHLPQQLKHFSLGLRETAGAFTVCGLMSMLLQWHRQGFLISPEQMSKLAVELLTHPLLRL